VALVQLSRPGLNRIIVCHAKRSTTSDTVAFMTKVSPGAFNGSMMLDGMMLMVVGAALTGFAPANITINIAVISSKHSRFAIFFCIFILLLSPISRLATVQLIKIADSIVQARTTRVPYD
jgi:hypothetical protein